MIKRNNLGFGGLYLTQHFLLKGAINSLSAAFEEGITHFDTAPIYGNGYSEKILGRFIRDKRDRVTIATKFGLGGSNQVSLEPWLALPLNFIKKAIKKKIKEKNFDQPFPLDQPELLTHRAINRDDIKNSLQNSLKNLQTDFIDYYLLHEAMPAFLSEDARSYLDEQKQKGVIRELGIAASYIDFLSSTHEDLSGFNILQYENRLPYKADELLYKFSDKKHFYHSVLRPLPYLKTEYSNSELAGLLLNRACKINPSGKALFSARKPKRLKENLDAFEKYSDLSLDELNKIIYAFHRS